MKISIITVTHNSFNNLVRYSDSFIQKHKDLGQKDKNQIEIIFVENSNQNLEFFIKKFNKHGIQCRVIYCKNEGFGSGCNLGAKSSSGDKLIFVNPDVIFLNNIIPNRMIEKINYGTCLQYQNSKYLLSFDLLPEYKNIIFDQKISLNVLNLLISIFGYVPHFFYPLGSFIFIDKELFFKAGKFNKKFFLYYEEAYLSKKIYEEFKLKPTLIKNIKINHLEKGSFKNFKEIIKYSNEGLITYCRISNNFKIMENHIKRLRFHKIYSKKAREVYKEIYPIYKKKIF